MVVKESSNHDLGRELGDLFYQYFPGPFLWCVSCLHRNHDEYCTYCDDGDAFQWNVPGCE